MGNKATVPSESTAIPGFSSRDELEVSATRPVSRPSRGHPEDQFQKRSFTITDRQRYTEIYPSTGPVLTRTSSDSSHLRSDAPAGATGVSDDLKEHVLEAFPKDGEENISLGTSITVVFDKEVYTVNINKLFEVSCDALDPSLNPVKGRFSYDSRQQRAEFTPSNTLFPNACYTVRLHGRAVTTLKCSQGANISDAEIHFQTCNPSPKSIGIRLKDMDNKEAEKLQIANFYDLYNSLVVWSTKKWGCSDEHVTGLYLENDEGKLLPLKEDHDVLNVKENDVIVVEIKD